MGFRYRGLWSLLVAIGLLLAPTAQAESSPRVIVPSLRTVKEPTKAEKRQASMHYSKLNRLYNRRRYTKALPHAEAMWRLVPKPLSAEIYATLLLSPKVERPCDAFEVLLSAMDLSQSKPSSNLVGMLNKAAGDCKPAHGWARIVVEPKDAIVTISGVRIVAPRTIGLSAGAHSVETQRSGYITAKQTLDVMSGTGATFQVSLQKDAAVVTRVVKERVVVPAESTPTGVLKQAEQTSPTASYALIGSGAVATVVGATLFGLAVRNRDNHESLVNENPNPDASKIAEIESLRTEGRAFEIAGYVSGGLGLAALVTGIVLLATHDTADDPSAVGQVSPMMLPGGGGGVVWGGAF